MFVIIQRMVRESIDRIIIKLYALRDNEAMDYLLGCRRTGK